MNRPEIPDPLLPNPELPPAPVLKKPDDGASLVLKKPGGGGTTNFAPVLAMVRLGMVSPGC